MAYCGHVAGLNRASYQEPQIQALLSDLTK